MSADTCAPTCPINTAKPLCALFEDAAYAPADAGAADCSTLVSESGLTQIAVAGGRLTAQHGADALLSTIWPLEAEDEGVAVAAVAPNGKGSWGIKLANGGRMDGRVGWLVENEGAGPLTRVDGGLPVK